MTPRGGQRDIAITVEPSGPTALSKLQLRAGVERPPISQATRNALGLPTDQPIVMTGHQAAWWHAGILAKYMACQAIANCAEAAPAWVMPDQDVSDYAFLEAPIKDNEGRWKRERIDLTEGESAVPAASASTLSGHMRLRGFESLPSVESGMHRLLAALEPTHVRDSAALQVSDTLTELMAPQVDPAPVVFASRLHQSTGFCELVERLKSEARQATQIYNDAARAIPQARVSPLARDEAANQFELPLWRLRRGQFRRPVFSHELDDIPISEIAPRALLLTGFMRLHMCDLFIHGTGGGVYDQITERWLSDWLGASLAPILVVSATMRLPLGDGAPPAEDIDRAVWAAHHARHHPAVLGQTDLESQRESFVNAIEKARSEQHDPAPFFQQLHDLLREYRETNAPKLKSLQDEAASLVSRRDEALLASDRTWPFFFHEQDALNQLRERLESSICSTAAGVS